MKRLLHFGDELLLPGTRRQALRLVGVTLHIPSRSGITISPAVEELLLHNYVIVGMA
jgi:hypothetical protein